MPCTPGSKTDRIMTDQMQHDPEQIRPTPVAETEGPPTDRLEIVPTRSAARTETDAASGNKRIAVVVPAYREEALIGKTIAGIPGWVDHVIVVDDASPDGTREAALAVADDRTEVITLPENRGVGGAIIAGHRRALDLGCDVMVVMAGDDQMDPAALPDLLRPILQDGYEFAKGNRLYSLEAAAGMPRFRLVGNMVLTFLNKAACGYWHLVDPQNGYTAVTASALRRIPLERVAQRYEFENDLLIWLNIVGARATDVNIPARYGEETSTIATASAAPRVMRLLARGFCRRVWLKYFLWSFSPIALLLTAGLLMLLVSAMFGAWVVAQAIGPSSPTAGTILLAALPGLMGFMLVLQAFVLDVMESPR